LTSTCYQNSFSHDHKIIADGTIYQCWSSKNIA
jgi:hypothetical protein